MIDRTPDQCAELQDEVDALRDEQDFWEAQLDDPPGTMRRGQIAARLRDIGTRLDRAEAMLVECEQLPPDPVEQWLERHPAVEAAIIWRARDGWGGTPVAYRAWSRSKKADLANCVATLRSTQHAGIPELPPFTPFVDGAGNLNAMLVAEDYAWSLYVAYVAQSLLQDIDGVLPWTLDALSSVSLNQLFDAQSIVYWYSSRHSYSIWYGTSVVTPSDPGWTRSFLGSADVVGATRRETLDRAVEWCRANLRHFLGGFDPDNFQAQWQYSGFPPVQRVIEGTVSSLNPSIGSQHYTAGCWGTSGFLRTVLRTVNIPVDIGASANGHALPGFPSEGLHLSHGDDPYSQISRWLPEFTIDEIFIDDATYNGWFGGTVPTDVQGRNVGRRPGDLAIRDLPDGLLKLYCNDQARGLDHASGDVYQWVGRPYTVAELEADGLWTRMDAKVAQLGGCGNIP